VASVRGRRPQAHGLGLGDLTGDGRLDLVAPGKDGLYVFLNEGMSYVGVRDLAPCVALRSAQ
jgi:hypothetical protein